MSHEVLDPADSAVLIKKKLVERTEIPRAVFVQMDASAYIDYVTDNIVMQFKTHILGEILPSPPTPRPPAPPFPRHRGSTSSTPTPTSGGCGGSPTGGQYACGSSR